jgi:hypothetical protein
MRIEFSCLRSTQYQPVVYSWGTSTKWLLWLLLKLWLNPSKNLNKKKWMKKFERKILTIVPWTTEYRTVRYSNGHFSDTFRVRLSNGPVFRCLVLQYLPGLFSSASLDCFGIKNILFMTLFFINRSRLGPTIEIRTICQNFIFLSGFQMVKTRWLPKQDGRIFQLA